MERIFEYHINDVMSGKTIHDFLRQNGFSRQNIIELKKQHESILLNGTWEYVTCKLHAGDFLVVHIKEEKINEEILPVKMDFSILYEDDDLMVINKPSGMPTHPSLNNYTNSLANAVTYYFSSQKIPFTFRCINRLDKDTTGLTIVAKHMVSANLLSTQIAQRLIHREYLALVDGTLPQKEGTIDAPIGRVSDSLISRCVDNVNGERAITHYKVLASANNISLVLLHLETGRTHQIRVHMAHMGCPLIGDYLYHPDYMENSPTQPAISFARQALHAYHLTFTHPITKEELSFKAPLSNDMSNIIESSLGNQPFSALF